MTITSMARRARRALVRTVAPSSKTARHERLKEELFQALHASRPRGIELPGDDVDAARALDELLKERPGALRVVKTGTSLSLFFTEDIDPLVSTETKQALTAAGLLLTGQNGTVL